ncbi:MAG: AAA family ATPase [Desulfobacterales bacterium]
MMWPAGFTPTPCSNNLTGILNTIAPAPTTISRTNATSSDTNPYAHELSIKNFAIIDDLTIHFSDGLTILSGETGAGKSIIINAINLLLGSRATVK